MNRPETPAPDPDADGHVTPVMAQYIEIKAANPDSLLFYRMGDFYELFFHDAEIAARALGIVLTKRGKHLGQDIPMCGVPVHRADEYLQRLIGLGHRVAVCEQTEDPAEAKKRGSKSVVRRDVVRLVTPGTITEETLLDRGRANYLLALARTRGASDAETRYGLAWIDISTGAFRVTEASEAGLGADLARVDPAEIVLSETLAADEALKPVLRLQRAALTVLPRAWFDGTTAAERLAGHFGVATLDAFGSFGRAETIAAAAALAYVEKTQVDKRAALDPPRREGPASVMAIDPATRASLELTRGQASGGRAGSLLAVIDRTVTGAGQRLLAERIASPLLDVAAVDRRLDAVEALVADAGLRRALRADLAAAPDLARPLARLALDRGGPRDLAAIAAGLAAAAGIAARARPGLPAELAAAFATLAAAPHDLAAELARALGPDLPLLKRDGGFVAASYAAELDETRALKDDSRRLIARLEADAALETGLKQLRVKHNNVLGWFIELPTGPAEKLREPPFLGRYVHRQTLAGVMRFTTTELADLEARIASAGDRALAMELAIFARLAAAVLDLAEPIRRAAEALAVVDVAASLAELAEAERWTRPKVDDGLAFQVEGGRHPVVEAALKAEGGDAFVPNDCDLSPPGAASVPGGTAPEGGRLFVVTGPNMGGKSTYLRQNALIAILAQAGAFVPARAAHVGIVDRLFSRVGAADDLARGRSTFMVEMVETAAILNQAGPRALVVLDEIGRGTATFDGLSIAWAAIEHLHEVNRCRALFATHYHELTALAGRLPRLANVTVKVKEWKGDVVFLHEIVPGAADRSYGIQVARLAGLPPAVIARAREVLRQLEDQDRKRPAATLVDELPLFAALAPREEAAPVASPEMLRNAGIAEALAHLDPDDLTPRAALEALYRLKAMLAPPRG